MNPRIVHRAWPALTVVALLALAAAAPAPSRTGPAPASQAAATCLSFSPGVSGAGTFTIEMGSGVRQPMPEHVPIAACSLSANSDLWSYVLMDMVELDPLTLAPDPLAISLRTTFCDPTRINTGPLKRFTFVPPIITRSLPGVADPPRSRIAFQLQEAGPYPWDRFVGQYAPDADPALLAAVTFGATAPLDGTHPVTAHAICDGGGSLADLQVVQSVRRTDSTAPEGLDEYVQRFRVTQAVEVSWIELAIDQMADLWSPAPMQVSIVEATGLAQPPPMLPASLVSAPLQTNHSLQRGPRWVGSLDLDHTVQLMPGREYWLSLRSAREYKYRTHMLEATENAQFTHAIGAFHHRALATDPWTPSPDQVLSFKLVGRALGPPLSVPPRTGFLLNVTPNPSSAAPEVVWSGATGPVKLEVFDARGRRVASGSGGAAGRWVIGGASARPLGSGVYFVRAQDSEGAHADDRLVIVR